jgi:hypothetical protein
MKTIDVSDATDTLSDYARKGLKEALVVTRRGRPLLALTPIRKGDWESIAVATNPKFLVRSSSAPAGRTSLVCPPRRCAAVAASSAGPDSER